LGKKVILHLPKHSNGLELGHPPALAWFRSLYASLGGRASVHLGQLAGSGELLGGAMIGLALPVLLQELSCPKHHQRLSLVAQQDDPIPKRPLFNES
jgi:hypothetical protein